MDRLVARIFVACTAFALLLVAPHTTDAATATGVARVAVIHGNVDLVRADTGDTVAATVNAPVAVGDDLITHVGARAEIELDYGSLVRVASNSQLRFTRLDRNDHVAQLALGSVELRVFRKAGLGVRVESPQSTLRPARIGRYRITVDKDGATDFAARVGVATVTSESGRQTLESGQTTTVTGSFTAPELHDVAAYEPDDFDRWADARDDALARAREAAYLDADLVGAADLDAYGRWLQDARYGRVWSPDVATGWTPYRDGRFVWQPYYGWTWVAAEPWGWAPYHYGNWFYGTNGWCWYPAPPFGAPYIYRPAVVAFFSFGGSSGVRLGITNVGWIPLGPFEPFSPWYGGTTIVDVTSGTLARTTVTASAPARALATFRNIAAPGAMIALRRDAFTTGRFDAARTVRPIDIAGARVVRGALPFVPSHLDRTPTDIASARSVDGAFARFSHAAPRIPSANVRFDRPVSSIAMPTTATFVPRAMPVIVTNGTLRPLPIARAFPVVTRDVRMSTVSPWDRFAGHTFGVDAARSQTGRMRLSHGIGVIAPDVARTTVGTIRTTIGTGERFVPPSSDAPVRTMRRDARVTSSVDAGSEPVRARIETGATHTDRQLLTNERVMYPTTSERASMRSR
ncbi:MAG: hypothetical protein NVS1B2_18710 [Vulcanimicrobiaceae bacterium]